MSLWDAGVTEGMGVSGFSIGNAIFSEISGFLEGPLTSGVEVFAEHVVY